MSGPFTSKAKAGRICKRCTIRRMRSSRTARTTPGTGAQACRQAPSRSRRRGQSALFWKNPKGSSWIGQYPCTIWVNIVLPGSKWCRIFSIYQCFGEHPHPLRVQSNNYSSCICAAVRVKQHWFTSICAAVRAKRMQIESSWGFKMFHSTGPNCPTTFFLMVENNVTTMWTMWVLRPSALFFGTSRPQAHRAKYSNHTDGRNPRRP